MHGFSNSLPNAASVYSSASKRSFWKSPVKEDKPSSHVTVVGRYLVIGFAAGGNTPANAIPKVPLNLALLNEREIIGCLST